MSKARLALLLPHLGGGGAERVAVNLANGFARRGHAVDMVLLSATGEFLSLLDSQVRVINLDVKRMRWVLPPLVRYLRRERPDVMLACMWPLTVIALWARALSLSPTRVIAAEHTTWSRSELTARRWGRWQVQTTMHRFFPSAEGIVAVSRGAADDLSVFAGIGRNAITVIYNPIVDKEWTGTDGVMAPERWWTGSHRRILAVGTLKPIKDYGTLLSAFVKLRETVNARLLILGEGPCRRQLTDLVARLGIAEAVDLPGFVSDPSPYFRRADLHVLSSTGEGFGNVIVEALAAGTPVVSTDCQSGPREILADGEFGRLVEVGNADALAQVMAVSLAADVDREALKRRANYFSVDNAVDQYLALLLPRTTAGQGR